MRVKAVTSYNGGTPHQTDRRPADRGLRIKKNMQKINYFDGCMNVS